MALSAPAGIYAAHLVSPGFEIMGVGIPGTLAFYHGHNRYIAWGVTAAGTDTQDLFLEELLSDPNKVRTPDGWEILSTREEQIEVRGRSEPVQYHVRSSNHGPFISDANPSLLTRGVISSAGGRPKGSYALALSLTGIKPARQAWYLSLARARNWEDFRESLRLYSGSGLNFLYADNDGHIGYQLAARVPRRESTRPLVPTPGWQRGHEWVGELDFDLLPRLIDSRTGWIATANARVAGPTFPHYLSTRWGDLSWRVLRIRDLLLRKSKLGIDDVREMQLDVYQYSMRM